MKCSSLLQSAFLESKQFLWKISAVNDIFNTCDKCDNFSSFLSAGSATEICKNAMIAVEKDALENDVDAKYSFLFPVHVLHLFEAF